MGFFNFRRSIKILPGVRWNIGKRSTSFTIGSDGYKVTTGTKGIRATVGIPGTGISYTEILSNGTHTPSSASSTPSSWVIGIVALVVLGIGGAVLLLILAAFFIGSSGMPTTSSQNKMGSATNPNSARASIDERQHLSQNSDTASAQNVELQPVTPPRPPAALNQQEDPFKDEIAKVTAEAKAEEIAARPRAAVFHSTAPDAGTQDISKKSLNEPSSELPAATPDYGTSIGSGTHVGPRGGVYHFSESGKKVYQKR